MTDPKHAQSTVPSNVLIVGATGGIGAALLDAYATTHEETPALFATHRSTTQAPTDEAQAKQRHADPAVTWLDFDYAQPDAAQTLQQTLSQQISALDTLVITTGLLHSPTIAPEKSLGALSEAALERLFRVNASGPLMLLQALQGLLRAASQPRIAVLSAQVGSIEDNHLGGWYSYRMAKAALNMGLKTASIELARWKNNPTLVAVHPGTTHSALSKPFVSRRRAPVQSAAEAGAKLHRLVQSLSPERSGQFLRLDGTQLPW